MEKVLIIKTSALGDILQSFGVVAYLRRRYPRAQIDWVAEKAFGELLFAHPEISRVIQIDTKRWRKGWIRHGGEMRLKIGELRRIDYDYIIDLQGNTKSAFVALAAKGKRRIGIRGESLAEKGNLFVPMKRAHLGSQGTMSRRYVSFLQDYFKDEEAFTIPSVELQCVEPPVAIEEGALMICPSARWENKNLSEEQWGAFVERIQAHFAMPIVTVLGEVDQKGWGDVFVRPSYAHWQAMMRSCRGVIALDSAALHLAATADVPTFSFFGPSHPDVYNPEGEKHAFIWGSCPYHEHFSKRCDHLRTCKSGACIKNLKVDTIFSSFCNWWEKSGKLSKIT